MNVILGFLFKAAGVWGGSVFVSLLLIGATTAFTQKWPASRMQVVTIVLLGTIAIVFIAGILFVHILAKRTFAGAGNPWFSTVLYAGGAVLTLMITAFVTLVVLNR